MVVTNYFNQNICLQSEKIQDADSGICKFVIIDK